MTSSCEYTYEQLAAFAAGEAQAPEAAAIERHAQACPRCRSRIATLGQADEFLRQTSRLTPATDALARIRAAATAAAQPQAPAEIMTLDEVAVFLRLSELEMEEIAAELPAFELAGRVRVRRARLIEWVEHRERAYRQQSLQSEAARLLSDAF